MNTREIEAGALASTPPPCDCTEKDRTVAGIVRYLRDQAEKQRAEASQVGPSYPEGQACLNKASAYRDAADRVARYWYEGEDPI